MNRFYFSQKQILQIFIYGIFFSFHISLLAQIQVSPGNVPPWTPETLISNVFLGDGVEVTNITHTGFSSSVGYFTNGTADIGLERGIVMSTGEAQSIVGEALGTEDEETSGLCEEDDCPDLSNSINNAFDINDASIYEITFIPVSDTLRFRYVFASEEYPVFACSNFNDVFGFYITGPNPSGGMYDARNIALIPDQADPTGLTFTSNPVTINNVNANGVMPPLCQFDNTTYYNENSASETMSFNAYLDVFTAQAIVTPCETYTIKLAIADVSDQALNTAVFLEAKSFGTGTLDVEATTVSLDGTIVEGCAEGLLCFSLGAPAESDVVLDYTIIGTAENGVDYSNIPTDLFIAQGDTSVCVTLSAIVDDVAEPRESIGIDIQRDPCNRDTFWIFVEDNIILPPDLPDDQMICAGDSVFLDGTLPIPLPVPPTFSSTAPLPINLLTSQGGGFSDIEVFGVQPFNLQSNVIKSVCIDSLTHVWDDDLDIYLYGPGGQFIELTTDNGQNCANYIQTCFTPEATKTFEEVVPVGYVCDFGEEAGFQGEFQAEGVWEDLWDGDNPSNGTWSLFVYDDSDFFTGTLHEWSICFYPLYQLNYSWFPTSGLSCADCPDPWAKPTETTTYFLTVTDSYGCSVVDSITITVEDVLDAPTIICGTIADDMIVFNWDDIGGTSYEVNVDGTGWIPAVPGPFSHTVNGLSLSQDVIIEVRGIGDCNGQIGTETCRTPDCSPPSANVVDVSGINCYGESSGTVEVAGAGVNGPFSYTIDGGMEQPSGMFMGLSAGDHTIQVIDNAACAATLIVTIPGPDSLASSEITIDSVSCFGFDDGQGTVSISGGTPLPNYSFAWSSGSTDSIATNLIVGENYVSITDGNGCQVIDTVLIEEPNALMASIAPPDPVACAGDANGEATVTPTGGTPPYIFNWSGNANNQITATATGLEADELYTVEITDANGCQTMASITLTENPPISFLSTSSTDATCSGMTDGSATVTPIGGTGVFTYQWQDVNMQTTPTANDLTVGTYMVQVMDELGCTADTFVTVSSPDPILVGMNALPTSCFDSSDGQIELLPTGGTPSYTYAWSDGGATTVTRNDLAGGMQQVTVTDANNCFQVVDFEVLTPPDITITLDATDVNCGGGNDGTATAVGTGGAGGIDFVWSAGTNQMNPTVLGLTSGWVTVTATDANGCMKIDSIEISEPAPIGFTTDSTEVDCYGNATGTATVTPPTGSGTFTYLWNDSPNNQTTSTATDLLAGIYEVTITDMNGCEEIISVGVTEPDALTISLSGVDANCFMGNDGAANLDVSDGVGGYTYLWTFPNGTTDTNEDLQNIGAGNYTVVVTDANSCTATDMISIGQPSTGVSLVMSSDDLICNQASDGTLTVTPSGGTPPYNYLWDDANGQTTATLNNVSTGTYVVTVSDNSACTFTASGVVNEQPEIIVSLTQVGASCHNTTDGSASIESIMMGNAQMNIEDYTIAWNTVPQQSSATVANLDGGQTYTVNVTDALGCFATASITIDQPAEVFAEIFSSKDALCENGNEGAATATGVGGIAPYTYSWSANTGNQLTETATDLKSGNYTVIVSDANGCTATVSVQINEPEAMVIRGFDVIDVNCKFGSTGSVSVSVDGGTPPYNYTWSNGFGIPTISDLTAGVYNVTISDINGCSIVGSETIREPTELLTGQLDYSDVTCFDGFDGQIFMMPEGGTPPYSYSIDRITFNGSSTQLGLEAGVYPNLTILDANGCEYWYSPITIDQPPPVTVNLGADTTIIYGEGLWLTPELNVGGNLTYQWSPAEHEALNCNDCGTVFIDSLNSQTSFELLVTDEDGCKGSDLITVFVRKLRELLVPTAFSPNGDNVNDLLLVHGRKGSRVLSIQVFDRWGEMVYENSDFEVNDNTVGWDGTFKGEEMNAGVFIWQVEVEYEDGVTEVFKGNTTLIR